MTTSSSSSLHVALFCAGAVSGAALYAAYERYRQQAALHSIAPINPQIPSNIRYPAQGITDMIIKYQENLYRQDPKRGEPGNSSYSIRCRLPPDAIRNALPTTCPETPESYATIFKDCQDIIFPGLTHWAAPDFMAYFKIHASEPSVLADFLISSINVVGFSWVSSPVATELEQVVLDWVARLLKLPDCFLSTSIGGGVIQAFASESALCGMIAGREAALQGYEGDAKSERASRLVVYVSDQTHAIGHKGCMVLGMPHMRVIPTRRSSVDPENYGMDPKDLHAAMLEDVAKGLIPCYVILTVGTTSTTAIDPIRESVRVLREDPATASIWIHVDGAYGGAAVICPEYRHWFDGIEGCDSICVNAHKWMLTGVCCSLMWVRDRRPLIQALALHPEYLKNDFMSAVQYKDWHIGLGRRFNALKLWFVLRRFGAQGMKKHIRQAIENAHRFERGILADGRFKRFVPVRAGLVCFTIAFGDEELIEALLRTVNEAGSLFLIHSKVDGVYFIRMTPGGLEVNPWHMDNAVRVLATTLTKLVDGNPKWKQAYLEWKQGNENTN